MSGPKPKRSTERVRRNKPDVVIKLGVSKPAIRPPEDKTWHVTAKRLYRSLKDSGQTEFWQQSDWEYARLTMDQISKALNVSDDQPIRAGQLAEINKMLAELMFTEPARRRARIELEHATVNTDQDATIHQLPDLGGLLA